MTSITFKTGDTFLLDVQRVDASGNPVSLAGVTVTAGIVGRAFSDTIDVTVTDSANGIVQLSKAATGTTGWPGASASAGSGETLWLDILYDDGTMKKHSATVEVSSFVGIAQ